MNIINKQLYKALKEYKRENTLINGMLKDNEKEYRKDRKIYQERYEVLNQDLYEAHTKIGKAIEYIEKHKRKDEFLNLNEWQTRDLLDILRGDE